MRTNNLVRSAAALATVLSVAGAGLLVAAPNPTYVPQRSVLLGPSTVAPSGTANYVLRVTYTNGVVEDFPTQTGATFTAVRGNFNAGYGTYTAPATPTRDRVSGSLTNAGVTTTGSKIITVGPSS